MNELEKYTLLWDLPQGYGNNYGHPYWKEIVTYLSTGLHDRGLHPGATLLDIGGGNGSLRGSFENVGVHYTSLDIAPNSGADIIGDISDRQAADVKTFDYGISIDVMEHLLADDEEFLANYTDGVCDVHLPDVIDAFRTSGAAASFVSVRPSQSFHAVNASADGVVNSIAPVAKSGMLMNGGYFVFNTRFFN